jgi:hypothetical protein
MRVYGNVVIVNALTVSKGHRRERDVSGDFSYTRVYVKRDGRWQAALSQYTRPATLLLEACGRGHAARRVSPRIGHSQYVSVTCPPYSATP